ncbi:hypothetical protein B0H16DRAFT_1469510 [Mycena metata]|uniref:Uncharacterized protein n=1 Tax=Mycena metata TaxID=1033252 RepID=A0AAD7HZ02_9AGAR|nr:hypothetical protein B0H16DRAFT_1469510 [Mycena metata]
MPLASGVVYKIENAGFVAKLEGRKVYGEYHEDIHEVWSEFNRRRQRSQSAVKELGEALDKGSCHFGSSAVGRRNAASAVFGRSVFQFRRRVGHFAPLIVSRWGGILHVYVPDSAGGQGGITKNADDEEHRAMRCLMCRKMAIKYCSAIREWEVMWRVARRVGRRVA